MRKNINCYRLTNNRMPIYILIHQYVNDFTSDQFYKEKEDILNYQFRALKKRGFQYDSRVLDSDGNFKSDNYGNYNLQLITRNDFEQVKPKFLITHIEDYIISQVKTSNLEWYTQHNGDAFLLNVINLVKYCIRDPLYCYALNVDTRNYPEKKHSHYSLWDFFQSYLIFYNNGDPTECVYIEIGYD